MSRIKFILSTSVFKENDIQAYESVFNGFEFEWFLFDEQLNFSSKVVCEKKLDPHYLAEVSRAKDMLEKIPNNEYFIKRLEDLERKKEESYYWIISIVFSAETKDFIDCKDCFFEDDYDENVKKCILAIVMCIVLSNPNLDIRGAAVKTFVDDSFYNRELFINTPIQNDAVNRFPQLFDTQLTLKKTMDWIKKYTSLNDNTKTTPTAFLALTYVLNREYHESLLYSIIGLESIYTPGNKGISQLLQKRITHIFPCITKDEIKNIYKMRSSFVHGELKLGHCPLIMEIIDNEPILEETEFLATALLLESLRVLIFHDAQKINFNETITHDFN